MTSQSARNIPTCRQVRRIMFPGNTMRRRDPLGIAPLGDGYMV